MNERPLSDRLLAAIPAAAVALALLALFFWEASTRKTPTIFTDELKWAQLSRAIAATGHAAQRGQPASFDSLYAYVLAPVWWIKSTHGAYSAAKYLDTVLMCLTAFPVYLTARRLVSPRAALVAAFGSICTSAMFYAAFLVPETIAYPMFAVCAYVAVRALEGGGRRWTIAAVVVALLAVEVRSQLAVAVAALALAAAAVWVVGSGGRRFRAGWTRFDHVGAALLLVLGFVFVNQVLSPHAIPWTVVTQTYQGRMWMFGLTSMSALALGMGLIPFAAGLASLWLPERRDDPAWRAFAAYTASAIIFFFLYTGVKAAYLSLGAYSRIEERNLIYLSPLLLIGTVVYFSARRPSLPAGLSATALTSWLVLHYGYQLAYPYFDSPGYGIATFANRTLHWTQHDIRLALAAASLVVLAAMLVPWARRLPPGARTALLATAALATAIWMLTGEITSTDGASAGSKAYYDNLPQPVNWVDTAAHGAGVTLMGQDLSLGDDLGLNLLEFWNRSIKNVWSLDGTAPGPGPILTPDLRSRDGFLSNDPGLEYALIANSVDLIGPRVAGRPGLELVRLSHPWRLRQASYGVSQDQWIAANGGGATSATGRYAYFGPSTAVGTLAVDVYRTGFCHGSPGTNALVRVGPVALNSQRAPVVKHATIVRRFHVADCSDHPLTFTARPPVAVQVTVSPLAEGRNYGLSDPRLFGAQVSFKFTPGKG